MLLSFVVFVAIVYVGLCAAVVLSASLLYYPQPRPQGEASATLPLSVDGAELVISVRAHEGPNAIVYFGGNGERDLQLAVLSRRPSRSMRCT